MTNKKQTGEDQQWSRRHFLRTVLSTTAGLVAAACGRILPAPTPKPTPTLTSTLPPATVSIPQSPLSTPTPVALSKLRPPTSTPSSRSVLDIFEIHAHRVHLPYVAQNGPQAAAALPPEPTMTPTPPKATATRRPPTPTPATTPFPPGPPSKLGLHVERNVEQELFGLLDTGGVAVVKTLELDANFVARIKQASPATVIIGRLPDTAQIQLDSLDPLPAARNFANRTLAFADDPKRRPYFDGWEGYNEPIAGTADEMKRLAEFEAERTRLLGEQGIRSVIGNFGTGTPSQMEMWPLFFPAIREALKYNGWLGLHEYSAPTIYYATTRDDQGRYPGVNPEDEGWLTLRYRKVYREHLQPAGLTIPLIFTELGVDGFVLRDQRPGPSRGKGWQDFTQYWTENGYGIWGPGAYIEQLAWFDAAMRQDDFVVGGCIFTLGASNQWLSYDIAGPTAGILRQYLSVHAPA